MRPIELNQRRAAPAGPAAGQGFYTPADPRAALERSPAMELTERARPAQGGTGSLTGPVLQRYQAEQAAAATAYDGAEKPGSGAPAAAGGQAFYTPADPRAALERSPAMELTERARPAQGGTGSLMGPVLQRYQAEQAAAATAWDGAEKPGVLSRIWAGVQDLAGDFADKEEPYWEKFRRGDVAGGLVNFAAVTAGLPQSLYLNGLSALLDLLAGKRPEFHYNMDGMDYLREIEERTGAPGAYTWLTEKQGSENLGDRLVGNLLGLGYNLGTDPASYLTAAGAWKAGQAGTPGTPAYGEYVSSGRAADSLSGAARQDAARAWDEGEENRSWETDNKPSAWEAEGVENSGETAYTIYNREQLNRGYQRAVEQGDISPFVTFEQYEQTAGRVEQALVGHRLPKGGTVEGYTTHFVDRVIGQHSAEDIGRAGMRRGVRIEDILDALEHPVQVTEIAVNREGLRGYVIIGKTCRCAVNPDTNKLIMVAPHR